MTQLTLFPAVPLKGRRPPQTGPASTRREAADRIAPKAAALQKAVLDFLLSRGEHGATDQEIQAALGMNGNTERPRRSELVERGLVRDSGMKRETASGRSAVVWVVKEV